MCPKQGSSLLLIADRMCAVKAAPIHMNLWRDRLKDINYWFPFLLQIETKKDGILMDKTIKKFFGTSD